APDMHADCVLWIANTNLLDDAVESGADRELLRSLAELDLRCEAVGRFTVVAEGETDLAGWFAERKWEADELTDSIVRVDAGGVPATLPRGQPTRPHPPDEAETAAFVRLAESAMDRVRPVVVLVRPGPWRSAVLAAAGDRGIAAVALHQTFLIR